MSTYGRLRAFRVDHGHPWFTKAWDLNLVIARAPDVGTWESRLYVACVDDVGREVVLEAPCTGSAWKGEWTHPSNSAGCVYVLDQHVTGGLTLGKHRGRDALVQRKPFRCVRWEPDGTVPTVEQLQARAANGHEVEGMFGLNVHNRASGIAPAEPRTDDSEGCTVLLYYHHHAALLELVRQQETFRGSAIVSPTFCRLADVAG